MKKCEYFGWFNFVATEVQISRFLFSQNKTNQTKPNHLNITIFERFISWSEKKQRKTEFFLKIGSPFFHHLILLSTLIKFFIQSKTKWETHQILSRRIPICRNFKLDKKWFSKGRFVWLGKFWKRSFFWFSIREVNLKRDLSDWEKSFRKQFSHLLQKK